MRSRYSYRNSHYNYETLTMSEDKKPDYDPSSLIKSLTESTSGFDGLHGGLLGTNTLPLGVGVLSGLSSHYGVTVPTPQLLSANPEMLSTINNFNKVVEDVNRLKSDLEKAKKDFAEAKTALNRDIADSKKELQITKTELSSTTNKLDIANKNLIKAEKELKEDVSTAKKDFIIFLGLFASLITYLSVQIQILNSVKNIYALVGLSLFTLAAILLFNLTLNNIAKDKLRWRDFINPIFFMLYIFLGLSSASFYIEYESTSIGDTPTSPSIPPRKKPSPPKNLQPQDTKIDTNKNPTASKIP